MFGHRIGANEQKRREARIRKFKCGVSCSLRWFKRKGWIAILFIVALTVFVSFNFSYVQKYNPIEFWHLKNINIEGNKMLSWDDIMQSAKIEFGMPMSELDIDSIESAIAKMNLIISAHVEKSFPSKLNIIVKEASPIFTVLNNGKATIYSEKGYAFPFSIATAMRLPVLDIESLDNVFEVSKFLTKIKEYDSDLYDRISQLSYKKEDKTIKVFLRDMDFSLLFPINDLKMSTITIYKTIENGFTKSLHCANEIDLRFNGFAYVKANKRCENG